MATTTTVTDQLHRGGVDDARTPDIKQDHITSSPSSSSSIATTIVATASRPSSAKRSKKMSQRKLSIPRRTSSIAGSNKRSRRPDALTLHRQSCQLFSSLDGVLALSREFTPLPSPSTSRSTTRPASRSYEDSSPSRQSVQLSSFSDSVARRKSIHSTAPPSIRISYEQYVQIASSLTSEPDPSSSSSSSSSSTSSTKLSASSSSASSYMKQDTQPKPPPKSLTQSFIITWTSSSTRKQEYNKIDRSHTGFRGLGKLLLPKSCQEAFKRKGWRNFFTGDCDGDSIRRYRMNHHPDDVEDDDCDAEKPDDYCSNGIDVVDEKQVDVQIEESKIIDPALDSEPEIKKQADDDSPCKRKNTNKLRRRLSRRMSRLLSFSG